MTKKEIEALLAKAHAEKRTINEQIIEELGLDAATALRLGLGKPFQPNP